MKTTPLLVIALLIATVLSCSPCGGLIEIRQERSPMAFSAPTAALQLVPETPRPDPAQLQALTDTPTPTPPLLTSTLTPTNTPEPTDTGTPAPTDTSLPTLIPTPLPPTNTSVPAPPPKQFSGQGPRSTDLFDLAGRLVRFDLSHDGNRNFAVWLMDEDGADIDLLANEIGSFNGSVGVPVPKDGLYLLNVDADGNWAISASYPDVSAASETSAISGHGKQLTEPILMKQGLATFKLKHNGSRNFAVWLYRPDGRIVDLLVNEIGPFDGSTSVGIKSPGPHLLDVDADGDWTIEWLQR